jgi:hypothetical protein
MFFGKFFPSGYLFLLFYLYLNLISLTYFNLVFLGKGQNVKNQSVESPKRTSKVQKEHQKSERQKSFLDFRRSDLFWRRR